MWYLDYTLSDKGIYLKSVDPRVAVEHPENEVCTIMSLNAAYYAYMSIKYKNSPPKWGFRVLLHKKRRFLETDCFLDEKIPLEYLNSMKFAIENYKTIPKRLLSMGVIPELKDEKEKFIFDGLLNNLSEKYKLLKYEVSNNISTTKSISLPIISRHKRKYHPGIIELNFLILIQEMFIKALSGDEYTRWMLNFSSPFHIWLICKFQLVYQMWYSLKNPINKRKHYENTLKLKKNYSEQLKYLRQFNINNKFIINTGIMYTIGQLMDLNDSLITRLFHTYIESLNKQAYLTTKTKESKTIDQCWEDKCNNFS